MGRASLALAVIAAMVLALGGGTAGATDKPEPTRIEKVYSERAGEPLRQFGYDLFRAGADANGPVLGAVADDHVLGVGDALQITFRGQLSRSQVYAIGTDGTIIIDGLRPVQAAGRTLRAVRDEIAASVSAAHLQTESFVSLANVRRMSVLVVGEVAVPGRHDLSAFATVLDALFASGGVRPEGSLRNIRVIQPDGRAETLDLYALIAAADAGAAMARVPDGTRIVVPPLGPTAAVAGDVKRPGIFELAGGTDGIALGELLALAGGALRPGPQRSLRLGFGAGGTEVALPVDAGDPDVRLAHGDILIYAPARLDRVGTVQRIGQVRRPGPLPLPSGSGASGRIGISDLTENAYLPFAAIARRDPGTGGTRYLPLDLAATVAAGRDVPLEDGDTLIVLGREDIAYLASADVLGLLAGKAVAVDCPGLQALAATLSADPGGGLAAGPLARAAAGLTGPVRPCPALFTDHPDLLPYVLGRSVMLRRGVLRPGPYPVHDSTMPEILVEAAGGRVHGPLEIVSGPEGRPVLDAAPAGVELTGAVTMPGVRPLAEAPTLRRLLGDGRILATGAYGLFAVVERFDPGRIRSELIPFAPLSVIGATMDMALRDRDRVHILHRSDVMRITTGAPAAVDAAVDTPGQAAGEVAGRVQVANAPKQPEAELLATARDNLVRVRGAVMAEGLYPVAGRAELADIVAAAGGLARDADQDAIEITTTDGSETLRRVAPLGIGTALVRPGDAVRVGPRSRATGSVLVTGEVARPGRYDLLPGEKLAAVLERAGGLTPQAYPAGALFIRESARRSEEEGLRRAAAELDRGLALALLRQNPPDSGRVELARQLSDALRAIPAVGRITVEADPAVLEARPEQNILLEDMDRIHIPKRPLTVTVAGEVLSPASLQFTPGKKLDAYLREAGGLTRYADSRRIFVLLPDGSSQPVRGRTGRHRLLAIPPGAIIVVPRDPEPYEFLPDAESLATILGQLAVASVALTVLAGQ